MAAEAKGCVDKKPAFPRLKEVDDLAQHYRLVGIFSVDLRHIQRAKDASGAVAAALMHLNTSFRVTRDSRKTIRDVSIT